MLRPAPSSRRDRGANHRGSNRGFSRLGWSAQPTVPVACSRCSREGGAILLSTGYGRYSIHTQHSASLHTPPVYTDYIIILSYRLHRVSVLWSAPSSSCDRGANHRGLNRGFSRLGQSAEPTLLSVLWYKPGVRLPPRVANMAQTPGETLGGKPVDVSVSIR